MHTLKLWITVSCLTFIFLCGISSTKAQTKDTRIADSLFKQGLFSESAIEYERAYYQEENLQKRAIDRLKRVQCLKQTARYSDALKDLNEIPFPGLTDSIQQEIRYEVALNSYLISDFEAASSQFVQIHFYSAKNLPPDKMLLLEILNDNQRFQYTEAGKLTIQWINALKLESGKKDSLLALFSALYNPKNQPRISKEKKATRLSTFLPGSGQAYDGFPLEGATNVLLSFAALGTGVYAFVEGYYLTGYLFGAGLLQKLYFGGIRRAAFLSNKGNYLRTKSYNDNLRHQILNLYKLSTNK